MEIEAWKEIDTDFWNKYEHLFDELHSTKEATRFYNTHAVANSGDLDADTDNSQ